MKCQPWHAGAVEIGVWTLLEPAVRQILTIRILRKKNNKNQKSKEQNVKDGDNYNTMTTINRNQLIAEELIREHIP